MMYQHLAPSCAAMAVIESSEVPFDTGVDTSIDTSVNQVRLRIPLLLRGRER